MKKKEHIGLVRVVACPRPLSIEKDRIDRLALPGATVGEHLRAAGFHADPLAARVFVDGQLVEGAQWEYLTPRPGQTVTARAVPMGGEGGGGKMILRIVAMIAVAVVSFVSGQYYLGPMLAGALGQMGAVGIISAGISATLAMAGMLAVNALIPPPQPKLDTLSGGSLGGSVSPTLSLTGGSNKMAPYAPIPRVYGRHLVFPPYAARPYTEIEGKDQYLRLCFCVGYGPLKMESFKIGATPIESFADVQMELRHGYADDPPLTLFTKDVYEDQLSILLTAAAGGQVRNTQQNADEISIDLAFPNGLATYDAQGVPGNRSVTMNVEYRVAGSGAAWTAISSLAAATASATIASTGLNNDLTFTAQAAGFAGNQIQYRFVTDAGAVIRVEGRIIILNMSGYTAAAIKTTIDSHAPAAALIAVAYEGTGAGVVAPLTPTGYLSGGRNAVRSLTVTDRSQTLVRVSWRWAVPRGQYEVRVTRVTADSSSTLIRDQVAWTTLRTITAIPPVTRTGLAYIALRIRATDQLNGQVDQLNLIATSILRDWDGSAAWVERATSNPASIYRDIVQGTANANRLADARVDLTALQAWHGRCVTHGYAFNGVVDYRTTVFEALRDVAAVGRASYGQRDGKHSVVEDILQTSPVHVLTPRNSWGFKGSKTFVDLPHAIKVRFVNPDTEWQQDERIVYNDGYNEATATKFETLDTLGVTDANQAWKLGRYHLAVAKLRPERYEVTCDFEQLVMTRGDLIRVVHDIPLFGLGAARAISLTCNSSGALTAIGLDEPLLMETGQTYGIRIRKADGAQVTSDLVTMAGSQSVVQLVTPAAVTRPAAADASGNAASGTYVGAVVLGYTGPLATAIDRAAQFDGVNGGYLTCGNPAALQFSGVPFSVELFVKPSSVALESGANVCLASKFHDANNSWTLQLIPSGSGALVSCTVRQAAVTTEARSSTLLLVNQWTHVVATYSAGTIVLYLNGVAGTTASASPQPLPTGTDLLWGRLDAGSVSGRYVGLLDEPAYYDTALSAARVAAHYAAREGDYQAAVIVDDPEGYWRLAETMSPALGDLVLYGVAGQESVELLVKEILPGDELTARIVCVDAAPGVHTAASGVIPPHNSQITQPALWHAPVPLPTVTQVISDESVLVRGIDGSFESRIVLSLVFASGVGLPASSIQAQYRRTGSTGAWTVLHAPITGTAMELAIGSVQDGLAYDIQLRGVNQTTGQTSEWVTISGHTVIGKTTPPAAPTSLVRLADRLSWAYVTPPPDFDGFRVRAHTGTLSVWESAIRLHDGLVTAAEFLLPGVFGTITYLVRAVDVAGLESASLALTVNEGGVVIRNQVDLVDHRPAVWPGTRVNGSVVAGDLVADSLTTFWGPNTNLFWGSVGTDLFWPTDTFAEMSYTAAYTPAAANLRCTLKVALTVIASTWYVQYRVRPAAADSSGNARHGTYVGAVLRDPLSFVSGGADASTYFSGVGTEVTIPHAAALNPAAISIEAWVFVPTVAAGGPTAGSGNYINKGDNGGYRIRIEYSALNALNVLFLDRGATNAVVTTTTPITRGQWHHVVATGDATGLTLYVDGTLVASNAVAYGGATPSEDLRLGATVFGERYVGSLDEVALYNTALSAARISAHSAARTSQEAYRSAVLADAPVGYWRLGDLGDWLSWPGELSPIANVAYDIKVVTAAGSVRGTLSQFKMYLDAPTIEQVINGFAIANTGTRITLAQSMLAVSSVALTIRGTAAAAIKLEVADHDATNGPLIYARDGANALVAATADGILKGY